MERNKDSEPTGSVLIGFVQAGKNYNMYIYSEPWPIKNATSKLWLLYFNILFTWLILNTTKDFLWNWYPIPDSLKSKNGDVDSIMSLALRLLLLCPTSNIDLLF